MEREREERKEGDYKNIYLNVFILSSAKPIRAGQGHSMTGIRGGGIITGGGAAVPSKIITDEVNKRKSLKGESEEVVEWVF